MSQGQVSYISTVKHFLDVAEKLKSSDPDQKLVFVDSDYNEYRISRNFSLDVVGEALNLDRGTLEENEEDYDEDCIAFSIE